MQANPNIKTLPELAATLAGLRGQKRRIVHCHGVFDLLHVGHLRYFQEAKAMGDVLVVTLTTDRYVNKGPHRPAFTEQLRAEVLAGLECIDFVAINPTPSAIEAIQLLRPDVYVKGPDYKDASKDVTGKILEEEEAVRAVGGRLAITSGDTFSSTSLINQHMSVLSPDVQAYLADFARKHSAESVIDYVQKARGLKVLLIGNVPPARLFDEMLKLLMSGHASACVRRLRDEGLSQGLLPLLDVILDQPLGERFVTLALAQTDERVKTDRPISPAFLFASLLWHEVLANSKGREKNGERPALALEAAMDEVLETQCEKLAITRKLTATMREVWTMQPRFEQRSGQRPHRLLESPRFRMSYDFLALRAASGEVPEELEIWWRSFQFADEETRHAMLQPETGPKPRKRRRRKKPADGSSGPSTDSAADDSTG